MLVEIKHDSIYYKGEKLKTGIVDISDEAYKSLSKRGLVKKVEIEQEEKPKRTRRKKAVEKTEE